MHTAVDMNDVDGRQDYDPADSGTYDLWKRDTPMYDASCMISESNLLPGVHSLGFISVGHIVSWAALKLMLPLHRATLRTRVSCVANLQSHLPNLPGTCPL